MRGTTALAFRRVSRLLFADNSSLIQEGFLTTRGMTGCAKAVEIVGAPTKIAAVGRAWFCRGRLLSRAVHSVSAMLDDRSGVRMNGRPQQAVLTQSSDHVRHKVAA
jgi:hypothetical protein